MENKTEKVLRAVCEINNISINTLKSKQRIRYIVDSRTMAQFFMRDVMDLTFVQIAKEFGLNHATILHSCKKHLSLMEWDVRYKKKWEKLCFILMDDFPGYFKGSVMDQLQNENRELKSKLAKLNSEQNNESNESN